MTQDEAINLVGIAAANFPGLQEKDMGPTAVLWGKMLADVPYKTAEKALLVVLAKARYFPTIAEVREAIVKLCYPSLPTGAEAFEMARQALIKAYRYDDPEDWLHLPEPVAKALKLFNKFELLNAEIANLPMLRSQFIKAYEAEISRRFEAQRLGNLVQLPEAAKSIEEKEGKYKDLYLT